MIKIIFLITAVFFLSSCLLLPNDAGIYNISCYSETFTNRRATESEVELIGSVIKNTAEEFGFFKVKREEWQDSSIVCYVKRPEINTIYDHLSGSNSNLSICFTSKPRSDLFITIRNWDRHETIETDYMKAFTTRLENELGKIIDMKKVRFTKFVTIT